MQLSLIRSNNIVHTVSTTASLKDAIRVLEETRRVQEKELKYLYHETLESLKPKNLARSAVTQISESPRMRHSLLSGAASLLTGYLSRRLVMGSSRNPFKKIAGSILQLGITTVAVKHGDEVEAVFRNLLLKLLGGGRTRVEQR